MQPPQYEFSGSLSLTKYQLPWLKDARCAKDPESIRDAYGDDNDPEELDTSAAEAFRDYHCLSCPVMLQCLAHAVAENETQGVRGGYLHPEREGMKLGEGILRGF